jgi:hypothetical protein
MLNSYLKNTVVAVAAASGMFAASGFNALAATWSRHGVAVTSHGAYRGGLVGECGGGTCSRAGRITGQGERTVYGADTSAARDLVPCNRQAW